MIVKPTLGKVYGSTSDSRSEKTKNLLSKFNKQCLSSVLTENDEIEVHKIKLSQRVSVRSVNPAKIWPLSAAVYV